MKAQLLLYSIIFLLLPTAALEAMNTENRQLLQKNNINDKFYDHNHDENNSCDIERLMTEKNPAITAKEIAIKYNNDRCLELLTHKLSELQKNNPYKYQKLVEELKKNNTTEASPDAVILVDSLDTYHISRDEKIVEVYTEEIEYQKRKKTIGYHFLWCMVISNFLFRHLDNSGGHSYRCNIWTKIIRQN